MKSKDKMATMAATATTEFIRILKFNLLSLRARGYGPALLRVKMNAGSTNTILPQIIFLANILLDLAVRVPCYVEANLP